MPENKQLKLIMVGQMATGKTSLSDYLQENYHATAWTVAEMIKRISHALVDHNGDLEKYLETTFPQEEEQRRALKQLLAFANRYKREAGKPRQLYQEVGEIGREINRHCWEEELMQRVASSPSDFILVDDVRSKEGFNFFTSRGFKSVKLVADLNVRKKRLLQRDGVLPNDSVFIHVSETEMETFPTDYHIHNESDDLSEPIHELNKIIAILQQSH
jgi:dephospho-CoA kinase